LQGAFLTSNVKLSCVKSIGIITARTSGVTYFGLCCQASECPNVQHDRPLFGFLKLFGEVHRCVFFGMSLTNIGILLSRPPGDT